jgi:hypothetical protein
LKWEIPALGVPLFCKKRGDESIGSRCSSMER